MSTRPVSPSTQAPTGDVDHETLLQQIRVISGSLARVAAVEATGFVDSLGELQATGMPDEEIALAVLDDARLADVGVLIDYVHRLQLRAAVWRRTVLVAEPDVAVAVGFADLTGYTSLSASLDADRSSRTSSAVGRRSRTTRSRRTARGW